MVRVAVRQHDAVEPHDAARLQPRQHRQLADAAIVTDLAAAIDQRPRAVIALQQRRVAMADVQPRQPQRPGLHAVARLLPHRADDNQRQRQPARARRVPTA